MSDLRGKFMKRFAITLCALGVALACGTAFAADYPQMKIRAATANIEASHHGICLNKVKEILERESGGKITMDIFYGGSLGDEQANVKQLRSNEIQMSTLTGNNLVAFAPSSGVFTLPYIFPTMESARKIFDSDVVDEINDKIAKESGTRPLQWLIGGYRYLTNSKHPIEKKEDMQGLKIRVSPSELQLATYRSFGIEPHPMAWSEVFNALQQGVIDGQENPYTVTRDMKFWEVQKYLTEVHCTLWIGPLLISERWYQKLNDDTKALLAKAAEEAVHAEWDWSLEQDGVAKQDCIDNGMQISTLQDEEKWESAAKSIWPEFYDNVGGKELVDKVVEIVK